MRWNSLALTSATGFWSRSASAGEALDIEGGVHPALELERGVSACSRLRSTPAAEQLVYAGGFHLCGLLTRHAQFFAAARYIYHARMYISIQITRITRAR
jgi:hypothetical protein